MGKVKKANPKTSQQQQQHQSATQTKQVDKRHVNNGSLNIILPTRMTTYTAPPTGWPTSMPYLSTALAPTTLSAEQQALLNPPIQALQPTPSSYSIASLVAYSPSTNPSVQIKPITDPNHPAYPQSGLFAAKPLAAGTHIVDYTGQIHSCPQATCATSDYDLAFLDRDAALAIDSALMGNEARFVNDYHGIRDQGPNAMFEEYYVQVKNVKGGGKEIWQARMGIWVMPSKIGHGIAKGEEICVSYGKGWWRARRNLMDGDKEYVDQDVVESVSKLSLVE